MSRSAHPGAGRFRVLIVGGGFGGLTAAQALDGAPVDVTVVDRSNHHLFQPLLYQVAMAGLSPAEIAVPIRAVLSSQSNVSVLLGEVVDIELDRNRVRLGDGAVLDYDFLVIAAGARTNYFGNDSWADYALGLKTVDDAVEIRRRVLLEFEYAERHDDAAFRRRHLTFPVIGGGPTGVELAGALAELSDNVLARDFTHVQRGDARVILIEGGPRILPSFEPSTSEAAGAQLADLGVEVRTDTRVLDIDEAGVHLEGETIDAGTIIWAAGVAASPLAAALGVELDRAGRIPVNEDCTIGEHSNVFAIGDIAHFESEGRGLPGVSPVAMQQARYVARCIREGGARSAFRYVDKGSMATIGRSRAVAEVRGTQLRGGVAWLAWLLIHIWYLMGFKNRMFVLLQWVWGYLTYRRGARLITGPRIAPRGTTPHSK